ncbi:hypothetical protein [Sphingobium lactosutens]|uniref:hypothetical protein n=1 Tax=Sphingobium lactosutens TaxID=522773 RepID=UPI001269277C|nr:hypothetical protein [Sphingobium lactosutens]
MGDGVSFLHGVLALRDGGDNLAAEGSKRGRAGGADLLAQLGNILKLSLRSDGIAAAALQRGNGCFQIELRDDQLPDHGKALASERVIRSRMTRPCNCNLNVYSLPVSCFACAGTCLQDTRETAKNWLIYS